MEWQRLTNELVLELEFNSQTELTEHLLKIAMLSDARNHHADIEIYGCSKMRLRLSSHDVNRITERDELLAAEILKLV